MEKLSFKERFGYGIGTGGEQFPFFFVNAFLFYFFNVVLGINALTLGTIMLAARIWDAINDPIMGNIADHTRSRWGSYRPWAFFATIPMGIFLTLCFSDFGFGDTTKVVFATIVYICFGMSNTASIIPLGSMINVMTTDYQERGVLASFREFGSALGNLSTSLIIPAILAACLGAGMSEARGYQTTAIVLSILCFVILGITFLTTKERVAPPKQSASFFQSFATLKGNVPAFSLMFSFFFIALFSCFRNMWNAYYAVYYLNNSTMSTMLLTIMAAAPLALLYFIPRLTQLFGKKSMLLAGCGFIALSGILFLIAQTSLPMNYVAAFVAGWGQVLTFSAMWSSLPDAADYGEYRNDVRAPGLVYALANFMLKLSMSVGAYVIGIILTNISFDQQATEQVASAVSGIYWFNGISLIVAGVMAAVCILPYNLTPGKAKEINATLAKKREIAG